VLRGLRMSDRSRKTTFFLRLTPLLGMGLLIYLIATTNLRVVAAHAMTIGWGMLLVIALGGFTHVFKTWAWRLTLRDEARKISFARSLSLRLISEATCQFGFVGMVGGEAARVSLLGSGVPVAGAVSSAALDRSLFILAGAVVTIAGIVRLVFAVPLSHMVHLYAAALVFGLLCFLIAGAIAIRRRWAVLSGPANAAARIPWLRRWLQGKEPTLKAAEQQIVEFYHEAPRAFWSSVFLNFFCHFLAIVEVYLIIKMLGIPVTVLGALILESLTKLINLAGVINPGNVGTYEGGNMAIGRLVRLTGTQGLMLALCRRARAIFWAIIGGICLVWLSKRPRPVGVEPNSETKSSVKVRATENSSHLLSESETILILAYDLPLDEQFEPALAKVATLPVILRAIIGVQSKGRAVRSIVVVNTITGPNIQKSLLATGRLPANIEWMEASPGTTLSSILQRAGSKADKVAFVMGNRTYHPALFGKLHDWNGEEAAIDFVSSGEPIGLAALTQGRAAEFAMRSASIAKETDLHLWIAENSHFSGQFPFKEVGEDSWQRIERPDDCIAAEIKLEGWLVKPTDGVFARMNRRISIPISRKLIQFSISPNMVSLGILGISLVSSGCFALGGYWYSLLGALLGVWTSILDGCDGEVARLKLQVSEFGCWLDTICDYLYYVTTFAGITIGLVRSTGETKFAGWCLAVFGGAMITFITASVGRKQLSGKHPEQYLALWQKKAESRSAGLVVNFGRYTEFIVRRCFLPYLLLVLAMLNLMPMFLYMAAFGANVAWIVSLRSLIAFSSGHNNKFKGSSATRPDSALSSRNLSSTL
jgi:phosphatidylglycerophosphate synthase